MYKIDEDNVNQAIYDYAWEEHGETLERYLDEWLEEFPDKDVDIQDELKFKNFFSWVMFKKEIPETGKTLAELFAKDTPGLSDEMKDNLYGMRDIIRSEFVVIEHKGIFLKLKDTVSKKIYKVTKHKEFTIPSGTKIEGRIHPFDDHYRFEGVFLMSMPSLIPDPDIMMGAYEKKQLDDLEDISLHKGTKLRTVLNKYPVTWINHMCEHYGLEARLKKERVELIVDKLVSDLPSIVSDLPEGSKDALATCMDNDGVVKYGKLNKYDDDMYLFWERDRPASTIGILRMMGLLVVGRMIIGKRRYKVAFIPNEIREGLIPLLSTVR